MKNLAFIIIAALGILGFSCKGESDKTSERYRILTTTVWTADSLLVNGDDASQPGEFLANLKGDAKFNDDGTGTFGNYDGTWELSADEKLLTIRSSALQVPMVTTRIEELTAQSLKIETNFLTMEIRMTFKAK